MTPTASHPPPSLTETKCPSHGTADTVGSTRRCLINRGVSTPDPTVDTRSKDPVTLYSRDRVGSRDILDPFGTESPQDRTNVPPRVGGHSIPSTPDETTGVPPFVSTPPLGAGPSSRRPWTEGVVVGNTVRRGLRLPRLHRLYQGRKRGYLSRLKLGLPTLIPPPSVCLYAFTSLLDRGRRGYLMGGEGDGPVLKDTLGPTRELEKPGLLSPGRVRRPSLPTVPPIYIGFSPAGGRVT